MTGFPCLGRASYGAETTIYTQYVYGMYLYIPPCRAPGGVKGYYVHTYIHTYVLTGGCARAPQEKVAVGNGPLQEDRWIK